ncbi:MAG TPA: arabinose ABC transporter substrate-binding protein [Armatimonadota bacterium]|jgi:L-arabinose transport system substrate-binding protein
MMKVSMMWLALGAAVLAAAGAGCQKKSAGGATSAEKIKIGFLVKQPEEKWFQNEWKFAQQCADKNGFDLVKIGATDGDKVASAIDNLAASGAKGFVICTPQPTLGPSIVANAKAKGLKVFSVDDQFIGPDGKFMDVPYMGISARKIGENVGEALAAEYKKRGWTPADTAAMALTFDELNTVKERTDGAMDALTKAGFPKDRIFKGAERAMDVENARNAADVVLTQHGNVKHWLVFSTNDEGVLGGVRALEGRGFKAADVLGIGIGGSNFDEWKKPEATGFYATVMISPRRHGYETTEYMYKWIRDGIEPPKDTRTTGILVTKENYQAFAKKEGLLD